MTSDKSDIHHSILPDRIFLSPPHMGGTETQYVQEAFDSNYIAPLGPQVNAFEKAFCEYTGFKHCMALNSGTAAMHLALRYVIQQPRSKELGAESKNRWTREDRFAKKMGERDKKQLLGTQNSALSTNLRRPFVLASTLTFIGSVTPAVFEGCDITFIDCDRETWNMAPDLLAEELELCAKKERLPVAVIPTDLYGQCCNLERIVEICDRYDVPVICDSAEAMGAKYKTREDRRGMRDDKNPTTTSQIRPSSERSGHPSSIGSWCHAGYGAAAAVFSFNGNKIITTSGGGMLASDDKDLIEKARFWSQQARDPFPHYEHTEIGYNYRMSNIVAAIGLGQLEVLEDRILRKREIFDYYRDSLSDLPGISFMPEASYNRCSRWLTVILIDPDQCGTDRETVRLALEKENIESRPVWKPMHLQPVFLGEGKGQRAEGRGQKLEVRGQKSEVGVQNHQPSISHLPSPVYSSVGGKVSEELFEKGLCLPSGTAMSEEDLERVIKTIRGIMTR